MSNNYPSGFEGEELAMLEANRKHETYVRNRRNSMIVNIILCTLFAIVAIFSFTTGLVFFLFPLLFWAGWNLDKFVKRNNQV